MAEFQWGEVRIEDAVLAGGFVQIPVVVLFDPDLSSGAKVTYGALLWYAWKYHGCPEQRVMAQELGVSLRTIQSHTAELERAGYIEVIQVGLGRPNTYVIKTLQNRAERSEAKEKKDPQKTAGLARRISRVKDAEFCASPLSIDSEYTTIQQQEQPASVASNKAAEPGDTVVASNQHPTPEELLGRLLSLGVTRSTARSLMRQHEPMTIYRWVAYTEQRLAQGWIPQESPAAWVVSAIRSGDWVIPSWFRTPEEEKAAVAREQAADAMVRTARERAIAEAQSEAMAQRRRMEEKLGVGDRTREYWERAKLLLEQWGEFSPVFYSAFLLPLKGRTATIATPVQFYCQQLERNADALKRAIQEVSGKPIETLKVIHFQPDTGPDG